MGLLTSVLLFPFRFVGYVVLLYGSAMIGGIVGLVLEYNRWSILRKIETGPDIEYWVALVTSAAFAVRCAVKPTFPRCVTAGLVVGFMASSFDEFKVLPNHP